LIKLSFAAIRLVNSLFKLSRLSITSVHLILSSSLDNSKILTWPDKCLFWL